MSAFPSGPTLNAVHTAGGRSWKWDGSRWKRQYTGTASVVSDTPPANPTAGMRWISSTLWRAFDYSGNEWIETADRGGSGREIELQKGATHLQWKYTDESIWRDLLDLSTLFPFTTLDGGDPFSTATSTLDGGTP